jgi:hypothetical protein
MEGMGGGWRHQGKIRAPRLDKGKDCFTRLQVSALKSMFALSSNRLWLVLEHIPNRETKSNPLSTPCTRDR